MSVSHRVQHLKAEWITLENFERYGQVIFTSGEGQIFNGEDAQLNVQNGIPRFYIMRLHNKGQRFYKITRHEKFTRCLGSLEGKD